jgi:hypothetical protein
MLSFFDSKSYPAIIFYSDSMINVTFIKQTLICNSNLPMPTDPTRKALDFPNILNFHQCIVSVQY